MSRAFNRSGKAKIAYSSGDRDRGRRAGTGIEQPSETGEACFTPGQTADMVTIVKIDSPHLHQDQAPREPFARVNADDPRGEGDKVLPASVALVPFAAGRARDADDGEAPPSPGPRPNAAFLAQLIATHQGMQQTRARGRVEADAGADAYADAYEEQPPAPSGRFEAYI